MRIPFLALATIGAVIVAAGHPTALARQHAVRAIGWSDTAPVRSFLEGRGLTSESFDAHVARLRETHAARVREGDLDHLVFYMLQSKAFTPLPAIEPALSAKGLVDGLSEADRAAFRRGALVPEDVPADVRARAAALVPALKSPGRDPRRRYFSELLGAVERDQSRWPTALRREYSRAMRFVYEKEFVAQRSATPAQAVADLYRSRGLSTDTAVEAGYLVSIGLGIARSLDPGRRVRRALIVGPGLDLAPRTALLDVGPPESYQPWTLMDALVGRGLARLDDLDIVAADVNPRVVSHLRRAREMPPTLQLISEIRDDARVSLSAEYREYFAGLGVTITDAPAKPAALAPLDGHLRRTVPVGRRAAAALAAESLDIVTQRFADSTFDLIVATNILPYFDDAELAMAMSNVAAMLAPGGVFLHNEVRPALDGITTALGMPFEQSRHAVIATVRDAKSPLFDSVWIHRKTAGPAAR